MLWVSCVLLFFAFLFLRVLYLLVKNFKGWKSSVRIPYACPAKLMIILGSGGHTGEMVGLLRPLNPKLFSPRVYVLAKTDSTSLQRIEQLEKSAFNNDKILTCEIPRSRELHQSWTSTVFSTFLSVLSSIPIYYTQNPDLILCNGPGTCVPICLLAFLAKVFWLRKTKIVFVESICRVRTLSLTGKIMLFLADDFLVQWPELTAQFSRVRYLGRLI